MSYENKKYPDIIIVRRRLSFGGNRLLRQRRLIKSYRGFRGSQNRISKR
jgi:hypothetical protein